MANVNKLNEASVFLIGKALYAAQFTEFVLKMILLHCKNDQVLKNDKRIAPVTIDKFLADSEDGEKFRKMTLGQLAKLVPEPLNFSEQKLTKYVSDRNLLAHGLFEKINPLRGESSFDHDQFLNAFIQDSKALHTAMLGFLRLAIVALAARQGKTNEVSLDSGALADIEAYINHSAG